MGWVRELGRKERREALGIIHAVHTKALELLEFSGQTEGSIGSIIGSIKKECEYEGIKPMEIRDMLAAFEEKFMQDMTRATSMFNAVLHKDSPFGNNIGEVVDYAYGKLEYFIQKPSIEHIHDIHSPVLDEAINQLYALYAGMMVEAICKGHDTPSEVGLRALRTEGDFKGPVTEEYAKLWEEGRKLAKEYTKGQSARAR